MLLKISAVYAVACATLTAASPSGSSFLDKISPFSTPPPVSPLPAVVTFPFDANTIFAINSSMPVKSDLESCVNQVATRLKITKDMKSDPAIFQDILKNTMYLDDVPEVMALFANIIKPVPFDHLISAVKIGITKRHPVIGVTLCTALTDPTTQEMWKHVDFKVIYRAIHHTYLLEHIVGKLGKDVQLLRKMLPIVRSKLDNLIAKGKTNDKDCTVEGKGILDKMFGAVGHAINKLLGGTEADWCRYAKLYDTAGIFLLAKDITVSLGMDAFTTVRETGDDSKERAAAHSRGISINVFEATTTDLLHGNIDNGVVGMDLMQRGFKEIAITGEKKKILRYFYQEDYPRLYETWNMAFITSNMHTLNLLYPKLLIPRLLYAEPSTYIYYRGIALWLTINFFLANEIKESMNGGALHATYPGQKEMGDLWGKINRRYLDYVNDLAAKKTARESLRKSV